MINFEPTSDAHFQVVVDFGEVYETPDGWWAVSLGLATKKFVGLFRELDDAKKSVTSNLEHLRTTGRWL